MLFVALAGCVSSGSRLYWSPPPVPALCAASSNPAKELLQRAAVADGLNDPTAPELYLHAALTAWNEIEKSQNNCANCGEFPDSAETYRVAVGRFLETARDQGEWVAGEGFYVSTSQGRISIPIQPHAFAWRADEFQELHAVGDYAAPSLSRRHEGFGLGAPVVAVRHDSPALRPGDRFLPPTSYFAATAILRPTKHLDGTPGITLELWDPQTTRHVTGPAGEIPLATDISAPMAYREVERNTPFDPFEMFVYPDNNPVTEGLYLLEPYQPGKIPVVFVHGLLSSPRTWIDLVNDLKANPEFNTRYQIWVFGYATGKPFIASAAALRRDLCEAVSELDAEGYDPALREIVLVGHSMGGLISKLQVASSGNELWGTIASEPLDNLKMSDESRERIREIVYFEPVPFIRRVVFVGTPHRGAAVATRVVGRVSSALVRRNPDDYEKLREIIADNRGAFRISPWGRLPTSIDMLEPSDRMLQATERMTLSDRVHFHTIAGTGLYTLGPGKGDGVVPLSSATHPVAESELQVKTTHTNIHRHPESTAEIWRILSEP